MADINALIQDIVDEYGIDESDVPELSEALATAIDDIASSFVSEIVETSGLSSIPGGGDILPEMSYADNDNFETSEQILQAAKRFEKILFG